MSSHSVYEERKQEKYSPMNLELHTIGILFRIN